MILNQIKNREAPEPITPKEDRHGYLSWIKNYYTSESLDCESREPAFHGEDNYFSRFGINLKEKDINITLKALQHARTNFQEITGFLTTLEKDEDAAGIIGIVNHLNIVRTDRLWQRGLCDAYFKFDNCVVIKDTNCFLNRMDAEEIFVSTYISLARLIINQPELAGRVLVSLPTGDAQEYVLQKIIEMSFSEPDLDKLESIISHLYTFRSLFFKGVSEYDYTDDMRETIVELREKTRIPDLAKALDETLKNNERINQENDQDD